MPASEEASKALCAKRFAEWWTAEELSDILSRINPAAIRMFTEHGELEASPDRLAEMLYDSVGPRFLRSIENDSGKRRLFLEVVLATVVSKGLVSEGELVGAARATARGSKAKAVQGLADVAALDSTNRWCQALATILGLPPSAAEKEHAGTPPDTEVVEPHVQLGSLYDYQYTTGLLVRSMLEGTPAAAAGGSPKRRLIAVPTGSGKTRMVVEAIVEWLNDGKPSTSERQRDSRFIVWVAQSGELCEQALSTFKSVFESSGRRGTTLRLHRFWGVGGALPTLGTDELLDEKGVIIATIQSLYKVHRSEPAHLERLARATACIVMDEAHHATASSYSEVLRVMGFNWDNRKKEVSELGIVLIGLTATPFRGAGSGADTPRLLRRFGGVHFPKIPMGAGGVAGRPRALLDCPERAYAGEDVRMLGERSRDNRGLIAEGGHSWSISRRGSRKVERSGRNLIHQFESPGEYTVKLRVEGAGGSGEASAAVAVEEAPAEPEAPPHLRQKQLYHRLIKRGILCEVYHKVLPSGRISLDPQDTKYMERFGEFRRETLRNIGKNYTRNSRIMSEMRALRGQGRRKILFFGCSVEHSRQIAMFLRTLQGVRSGYVDSKMDPDSRAGAIEAFRSGDLEVLCNFDVLTTGFDAPNVDCVFVGRPVRSTLLYTQMVGRGMRGVVGGGTDDMLIVDIDDNFQLREGVDAHVAELGWKTFREYWRPWEEKEQAPKTRKRKRGGGAGAGGAGRRPALCLACAPGAHARRCPRAASPTPLRARGILPGQARRQSCYQGGLPWVEICRLYRTHRFFASKICQINNTK